MTDRSTPKRSTPTMRDVDHTHPFDDRTIGELFLRGPKLAADGGHDPDRHTTVDGRDVDLRTNSSMLNVEHTPPFGEGTNRVLERGFEHGLDSVVGTDFEIEASDLRNDRLGSDRQ